MAAIDAEMYRDHAGEWRWRVKDPGNHEILANSEGYGSDGHCRENLDRVVRQANEVNLVVLDDPRPVPDAAEEGRS